MKKIITAIVSILLLLPMVVSADLIKYPIFANEHLQVGGYFEEFVIIPEGINFKEKTFEYDPEYLFITAEDVQVYKEGINVLKTEGVGSVTVENGKVTVKVNQFPDNLHSGQIDWQSAYLNTYTYIKLNFKLKKAGTTTVKSGSRNLPNDVNLTIEDVEVQTTNCISQPVVTEEVKEESKEKPKEEVTETPKEENTKTEEKQDVTNNKTEEKAPKGDKNKDLVMLISIGCNALLLLLVIVLIIKGKKKNKVEEKISQ